MTTRFTSEILKDKGFHFQNGTAKRPAPMVTGFRPVSKKDIEAVERTLKPVKVKFYKGTEESFTKSVAKYLNSKGVLYTHVANELKTQVRKTKQGVTYSPTGNKLKQMGKKAGVPDMLIFKSSHPYVGLAIELKVGKNTSSPAQLEWQDGLRRNGWMVVESRSLDEVINVVDKYLKQV